MAQTPNSPAIPEFGPVVARRRLTGIFRGHRPEFVVLCAPHGYGKSILASQLAADPVYSEVIWINVLDEDATGEELTIRVGQSVSDLIQSATARPMTIADAAVTIAEGLRTRSGCNLLVVLDGCNALEGGGCLQALAATLRSHSKHSSLVVACRRLCDQIETLDSAKTWLVEAADLRFDRGELGDLARLQDYAASDAEIDSLMHRFDGHPALCSILLRHSTLDPDSHVAERDLRWHADKLVSSLSLDGVEALYLLALLGEDSLRATLACLPGQDLDHLRHELSTLSPLLILGIEGHAGGERIRVHAALRDAAYRRCPARLGMHAVDLRAAAIHQLVDAQRYERLAIVIHSTCTSGEVLEWLERIGGSILRYVGVASARRLLDRLAGSELAASPRCLLLHAKVLREQEQLVSARENALLAACMAESLGDEPLRQEGLLLVARIDLDSTNALSAVEVIRSIGVNPDQPTCPNALVAAAFMAMGEAHAGNYAAAMERASRLLSSLGLLSDLGSDEAVFTVNSLAAIEGLCAGDWVKATRLLLTVSTRRDLSPLQMLHIRANLAAAYLELGLLTSARRIVDDVIASAEAADLRDLAGHVYATRAAIRMTEGEFEDALQDYARADELLADNRYVLLAQRIEKSLCLRAIGRCAESLAMAEEVQLAIDGDGHGLLHTGDAAILEAVASLLSIGDVWSAKSDLDSVRERVTRSGSQYQLLRADLLSAEISRLSGDIPEALSSVARHAAYLRSGSANWLLAMLIRAFPGLVFVITEALGAEVIPVRALLMLPIETLDLAVSIAGSHMSEQTASMLYERCGRRPTHADRRSEQRTSSSPPTPCLVRVFGGLEVMTPQGSVEEADWRKRKARLLFLNLVLRQHQDIPRDVLLERLWPDMDEEHALRNFYVTWSTMKRALSCTDRPSDAKALVQCTGGVCRVTRLVRSDLDEFDELLAALRAAVARDEHEQVRDAAGRLIDIYRGELLPGDLYEEWFGEIRERTKHDFCDAMMIASASAAKVGRDEDALTFLRKASSVDPWREDVYQAMMRCQMGVGQRSRAIETYFVCRSRLTEDLGIDPSVETTRLYQAVLAMDAGADIETAEEV